MDIKKIASRVASHRYAQESDPSAELQAALDQALQSGWKLIRGILDISDNIYYALALTKNPDAWEPYKGHRDLEKTNSFVLAYWFEDDLTAQNNSGELIYEADMDEDTGEEIVPNTPKFEYDDPESVVEVSAPYHTAEVLARVQGVLDGTLTDRWNDAPRLD